MKGEGSRYIVTVRTEEIVYDPDGDEIDSHILLRKVSPLISTYSEATNLQVKLENVIFEHVIKQATEDDIERARR